MSIMTRLRAWTVLVLNPGRCKRFFSSPKRPARLWGPPNLLLNGHRGSFSGIKRPGFEVDHSHLVQALRTSGSIPLVPLYSYVLWPERNLLSTAVRSL